MSVRTPRIVIALKQKSIHVQFPDWIDFWQEGKSSSTVLLMDFPGISKAVIPNWVAGGHDIWGLNKVQLKAISSASKWID